jgi:hypothetical protein
MEFHQEFPAATAEDGIGPEFAHIYFGRSGIIGEEYRVSDLGPQVADFGRGGWQKDLARFGDGLFGQQVQRGFPRTRANPVHVVTEVMNVQLSFARDEPTAASRAFTPAGKTWRHLRDVGQTSVTQEAVRQLCAASIRIY